MKDYDLHNDIESRPPKTYVFNVYYKNQFLEELEVLASDEIVAENRAYEIATSDLEIQLSEEKDYDMRDMREA